jgi:hypothetical protein
MKIIITESQLNLFLNEESLKQKLLSQIEENGWTETAELVGYKNLLNIVGYDKLVDLLISSFNDLNVITRGRNVILRDNHLPIMETTKDIFGENWVTVYNDHIILRLRLELNLDSDIIELYEKVRREFIRELINRFPELSGQKVEVFKDSGLYKKYDSFEL